MIAAAVFTSLAALTSCSKEARQEAAAESAAESAVDVVEDYCDVIESIKDKESAQKAIEKMDGIADDFGKIAGKSRKAAGTPPDAEAQAKMQEDMKPLNDRLAKAMPGAMGVLATDPALVKAFQEKSMLIATKMQEAATK
ncbi:MAG: hypothetical protein V4733_01625 [Verrucomicrobiota bacterium]